VNPEKLIEDLREFIPVLAFFYSVSKDLYPNLKKLAKKLKRRPGQGKRRTLKK
jgi:hypothetical protein